MGPLFRDRADAGRRLATRLAELGVRADLVVGLARGGVTCAAPVARVLGAPLDALAVRKVGHPANPEYALGAVAPGPGGAWVRGPDGLSAAQLEQAVARSTEAAAALDRRLHAHRPAEPVAGRSVVLVDDGLATGATMLAAVRWARQGGAARVTVAVPVGARETVVALAAAVGTVVALEEPEPFGAVGMWYADFGPVEEADVLALLEAAARVAGQRP